MTDYTPVSSLAEQVEWEADPRFRAMRDRTISHQRSDLVLRRRRVVSAGQLGAGTRCGAINPGALGDDSEIQLIVRGEPSEGTWLGRWDQSLARALWCTLDSNLAVTRSFELRHRSLPARHRVEDWRLFRWRDQLFTNHSVYTDGGAGLQCRPGISLIDLDRQELEYYGQLEPPFGASNEEKNWSVFAHGDTLFCVYSVFPWIVLEVDIHRGTTSVAVDLIPFRCEWIHKDAPFVANSTNPVLWDPDHYVMFIHDYLRPPSPAQRNRIYMQYAMLVDRETLLPRSVIPTPLVIGGAERGRHSGVHYTMSLVNRVDALCAFYGEADSHSGVILFDKEVMAELFDSYRLST